MDELILGCKDTIIPQGIKRIGEYAFADCDTLTSIELPNSVTSIGEAAFYDCSGLTSISIPASVTSIEAGAFAGCAELASITVDDNNNNYDSRNGCNDIISTNDNVLICGC